MGAADGSEFLGGLFSREIALGFGQQFVADHEFLDRGGAQQRGIEMRMQLPGIMRPGCEGRSMPTHRIGKGGFKEIVVTDEQFLENGGELVAKRRRQLRESLQRLAGQQKDFIRPERPVRNHRNPAFILDDDTLSLGDLMLGVIEQQGSAMSGKITALVQILDGYFVRQKITRPDLAVRMGVGAPHDRSFVFKNLHPLMAFSEFPGLILPGANDLHDLLLFHLGQREVMPWMKTDDPADAGHRLLSKQGARRRGDIVGDRRFRGFGKQGWKVVVENKVCE